jgi:hypothetical protein
MKARDVQDSRHDSETSAKTIEIETAVEELEYRGAPNAVWGTILVVTGGIVSVMNS